MCETEVCTSPIFAEGKTKIVFLTDRKEKVRVELKPVLTDGDGEKKEVFEWIDSLKAITTSNIFSFLRMGGIRNHFMEKCGSNSFHAIRCTMIPLEVVVRRSSPPRSSYLKRHPQIKEGTIFNDLIVEFFLKDDKSHDPFVYTRVGRDWLLFDAGKPIMEGKQIGCTPALLTGEELAHVRGMARTAFILLEKAFTEQRLFLHDFKVEFGRVGESIRDIIIAGTLCLDEMRLTENGKVLDKDVFRAGGDPAEIMRNYAHVAAVTERFFEDTKE